MILVLYHEIDLCSLLALTLYICAFADGKIAKFGAVEEVMTEEVLSQIYRVDFEILKIEGKPLSIYY